MASTHIDAVGTFRPQLMKRPLVRISGQKANVMRLWRRVLARAGAVSIRHYFPSSTAQSLSVADSDEAHQYVRKTCLERFPHATSFRHDLPCIFLASGKPFQPLLAACRKTGVSRHPHRCLTRPSGSRTFCFSYDRSRRIFLVSAYAYQKSVSLVEAWLVTRLKASVA
jgi:hypothetical protein